MANCFLLKLLPQSKRDGHLHLSNHVLFDNTGSIKSKSVTKIIRKSNFIEQITSYFTDKLQEFKVFEKYQEYFI